MKKQKASSLLAASRMPGMIEFAKKRTEPLLKNGINFDVGLKDLLAAAWMAGFVDCVECHNQEQP